MLSVYQFKRISLKYVTGFECPLHARYLHWYFVLTALFSLRTERPLDWIPRSLASEHMYLSYSLASLYNFLDIDLTFSSGTPVNLLAGGERSECWKHRFPLTLMLFPSVRL